MGGIRDPSSGLFYTFCIRRNPNVCLAMTVGAGIDVLSRIADVDIRRLAPDGPSILSIENLNRDQHT